MTTWIAVAAASLLAALPACRPSEPENPAPAPRPTAVPDHDGDGVADSADRCPAEREDRLCVHFDAPRECCGAMDGCPHPDLDEDDVARDRDACPDQREDWNEHQDADGCPDLREVESEPALARAYEARRHAGFQIVDEAWTECSAQKRPRRVIQGQTVIFHEVVPFDHDSVTLHPSIRDDIEAVANGLREHPEIVWVEIGGHAEPEESDDPVRLSFARAQAVVDALVEHGTLRERLGALGYGAYCPRSSSRFPGSRRVEITIVLTEDGLTAFPRGCEAARAHGIVPLEIGAQRSK